MEAVGPVERLELQRACARVTDETDSGGNADGGRRRKGYECMGLH